MATKLTDPIPTPVLEKAPWPYYGVDEIAAVTRILESGKVNYWHTGEESKSFEEEFAAAMGCKYGVALTNGTVALELALHAIGIEPGEEVIVTPRTFIASASCAVARGAVPVFADVDRDSGTITAETIAAVITPKTRAIIAVHLGGWPCEMDPIMELAGRHGLKVIEDCAQCHGATYKGRPCGSLGDVAAWSFCQDKIMSTGGEGGMLTTNDHDIWNKAWSYKDHGKSHDAVFNISDKPGFKWLHESFGTNWRLTEMQSAIGRIQLAKLPDWVNRRRANAALLIEAFLKIPALRVPQPPEYISNSFYRCYAYVRPEMLKDGWNRDRIIGDIAAQGLPGLSGICPEIYLEKAFEAAGLTPDERLPVARELGETSMMFLVHPTMGPEHINAMIEAVNKTMEKASPHYS